MAHLEDVFDFLAMVIVQLAAILHGCLYECDVQELDDHEGFVLCICIRLPLCANDSTESWLTFVQCALR